MWQKKLVSSKYIFHYILWILVTASIAVESRSILAEDTGLYVLFVFAKTSVLVAIVYLNIFWLYPLLYKQKQFFIYFLIIFLMAGMAGAVNMQVEERLAPGTIFNTRQDHFLFFIGQLLLALQFSFLSFLLNITVDFYTQKEELKKIELQKATAELNFLKAQVNPHFLFNTLNNLYALTLQSPVKSAEAILKLADIMKYILSEGTEDKVTLEKEIKVLYNYIELERLRKPDAEIVFQTSGEKQHNLITPLLLLPLVENAFKHGLNSVAKNGFIRINMLVNNGKLQMTIENNMPPLGNEEAILSLGIGIENVSKRLKLLYPGKHEFTITNSSHSFLVNLQLYLI